MEHVAGQRISLSDPSSPLLCPGREAPLHRTRAGLQHRGFPAGAPGPVLLLRDAVQKQPRLHLRLSGAQTQLAERARSGLAV